MKKTIKEAFENEMNIAISEYGNGDFNLSFSHLERAHILGQSFVIAHTKSHWWMLKVGIRTNNIKEIIGQITRIIASIVFSKIWVPLGNTGGANVSPIKPMPIPEDLKKILESKT